MFFLTLSLPQSLPRFSPFSLPLSPTSLLPLFLYTSSLLSLTSLPPSPSCPPTLSPSPSLSVNITISQYNWACPVLLVEYWRISSWTYTLSRSGKKCDCLAKKLIAQNQWSHCHTLHLCKHHCFSFFLLWDGGRWDERVDSNPTILWWLRIRRKEASLAPECVDAQLKYCLSY